MAEINEFVNKIDAEIAAEPKVMSPDYYRGGQWGQSLELLRHLCEYSENILMVSGPSGIGKTAMLKALSHCAPSDFKLAQIDAYASMDITILMQQIASGFSISWDCAEKLQVPTTNGAETWVLLIDEAHKLSISVLAALFQLREGSEGHLHIVLFTQPCLEQELTNSSLKEQFDTYVHIIELERLTLIDVESLLLQQWRAAGNQGALPFDKQLLKNIHSLSQGLPSEVLKLAKAQVNGDEIMSKGIVAKVIGSLSPIMLGLTLFFGVMFFSLTLFFPESSNFNFANFKQKLALKNVELPLEAKEVDNVASQDERLQVLDEVAAMPQVVETSSKVAQKNLADAIVIAKQQLKDEFEQELTKLRGVQQELEGSVKELDASNLQLRKRNSELEEQLLDLRNKKIVKNELVDAPLPNETHARDLEVTPDKKAIPDEIKSPAVRAPIKQMDNIDKGQMVEKNSEPKNRLSPSSNVLAQEERIMQKPADNFTLQLLGASKEAGIQEFIEQNKLDNAYYYRTSHNGKDWFILVHGEYSSRDEAQSAIRELPLDLQELKPWARNYASVQKIIDKRK